MKCFAILIILLLFIITGCSTGNDPEYELKHGLYDDFDGNGCHQAYNDQGLAEAGVLSSQLWRGQGEVVDSPISVQGKSSQIYEIVNENDELLKNLKYILIPSTYLCQTKV